MVLRSILLFLLLPGERYGCLRFGISIYIHNTAIDLSAAELLHQCGRSFQHGNGAGNIHSFFKMPSRFGAELVPYGCLADYLRRKESALQEDLFGSILYPAVQSAEYARNAHRPFLSVTNHQVGGVQRYLFFIERSERCTRREVHHLHSMARYGGHVIGMQRLPGLMQYIIGDVHDVADRFDADRLQAVAHPGGRFTGSDPADTNTAVARAGFGIEHLHRYRRMAARLTAIGGIDVHRPDIF